jgi:hypothetical protein
MNKKITLSMTLMLMLSSQVHASTTEPTAPSITFSTLADAQPLVTSALTSFENIVNPPSTTTPTSGSKNIHLPTGIFNHIEQGSYTVPAPSDVTSSGSTPQHFGSGNWHQGNAITRHYNNMTQSASAGDQNSNALYNHFNNTQYTDSSTNTSHQTGHQYGIDALTNLSGTTGDTTGTGDTTTTV